MEQNNKKIEFGQVLIRRYMIIGERRISNYWWAIFISLGSVGFLSTGITSYFWGMQSNMWQDSLDASSLFASSKTMLPFFPQGLLMSFYGSLGFLLSLYWNFDHKKVNLFY